MNVSSLSITNPTPRDWAKLNSFFRYAYQMKGEVWQGGSPVLKNNLGRTNYSLDKDLFIAELKRRIVGISDVMIELRIARAIVEWFVHPAVHRKRVGRELDAGNPKSILIDGTEMSVIITGFGSLILVGMAPVNCELALIEFELGQAVKKIQELLGAS